MKSANANCLLTAAMLGAAVVAQTGHASDEGCRRSHALGLAAYSVSSEGLERRYFLYVPHSYDGRTPLAAVVDLHGSGSRPEEQLAVSGMAKHAERLGFAVILPVAALPFPAGGTTWNVPINRDLPSDVAFVRAVLDDAAARLCLDASRIYAAGFSGGARLASLLACELPERIAAIGAVGGLRPPQGCAQGRAVPIIAFHGTADPVNPYAGGGPAYWGVGVEESLRRWARHHGCGQAPERERLSPSATRTTYRGCRDASELVLYRIDGAGHVWPGSDLPFPRERFGEMTREVSATQEMLRFFARHGSLRSTVGSQTRAPGDPVLHRPGRRAARVRAAGEGKAARQGGELADPSRA